MSEMFEHEADEGTVVRILNEILAHELAGAIRYTQYSLRVFGLDRNALIAWLQAQANESLLHAQEVGERINDLAGEMTLALDALPDDQPRSTEDILRRSLEHERAAVAGYRALLRAVEGRSLVLEEFARQMVASEVTHLNEVGKMLRTTSTPDLDRRPSPPLGSIPIDAGGDHPFEGVPQ